MNSKKFIFFVLAVLLVCTGIFLLQNLDTVSIHWLFWSFQVQRAWLVLLLFGTGLLSGLLLAWLLAVQRRLRQRSRADHAPDA
ncbi:MAG: lipopolysaccharide assembly protein LapA domain-containing protein [Gammaproteobacteria bacterium]|jgi:uncharacterized integral membrane protein